MKYYKPCEKGHNPYIDLRPYRNVILENDENLKADSEAFQYAIVVLYGAVHRLFNGPALAWHTNVPCRIAVKAVRNLKRCKIWNQKGKIIKHEYATKWASRTKHAGLRQTVGFWLDVLVAEEKAVKIKGKYGLREWAEPSYSEKVKNRFRWMVLKEYQNR